MDSSAEQDTKTMRRVGWGLNNVRFFNIIWPALSKHSKRLRHGIMRYPLNEARAWCILQLEGFFRGTVRGLGMA